MSNQLLSTKASALESMLAKAGTGEVIKSLQRDTSRQLADRGITASNYDIYAIRSNRQAGDEIYGPHKVHVGSYDEEMLHGRHTTLAFRFRDAVKRVSAHAQEAAHLAGDPVDFAHRTVLLWSEISQLKDFLTASDEIDELIAGLRTARFQFLRHDTPPEVVSALADVLSWIVQAPVLDLQLVDRVLDRLDAAGIDAFAQDSPAEGHG